MLKKALLFIIASFGFAASLLADNTRFSPYSGTLDIVSSGSGTLSAGNTMYINNVSLTSGTTAFNVTSGTVFGAGLSGTTPVFQVGGGSFVVRANGDVVINDTGLSTAPQWPFLYIGGRIGAGINLDQYTFGVLDGRLSILQNGGFSTIDTNGPLGIDSGSSYLHLYAYDHVGLGSFADDVMIQSGNMGIGTTAPTARLHVAGTALVTSTATFTPTADGTGTVKITNAAGDNRMFETDVVSTDTSNLVPLSDADMEGGVGNWTNIGLVAGTLSSDTTTKYFRNKSIKYISTTAANDGIKLPITLSNAANYTMTFWINATAAISTYQMGYSSDGSTVAASIVVDSFTSVGNKWIKAQGQFTTPAAHSGTPFIFIKKSDTSARTFFVDGVCLKAGSASTIGEAGFYVGKLNMAGNSILTQPLNILPDQDSSHALAVYSSVGREIMRVDTSNRRVSFLFDASASGANPADAFSVNGAMGFWPGGTGAANTAGIKIREGTNGTQVGQLVFFPNLSGDMVCQTNNGASSFRIGSGGTQVMEINNNGRVGFGSIAYYDTTAAVSPSAHVEIAGEADLVQQEIFANGTQTNDLLRISDNTRASKLAVDKNFGLAISTATNGRLGQAVLVGGTVTVNNTSVTANTLIFLTDATSGGTLGTLSYSKIAGTSFTINSTNVLDTSTVNWLLIEMLP
jgi:hypothetical protein